MTDIENRTEHFGLSGIVWLILTCAAIVLYGFIAFDTVESDWLRFLGYCIPIALVSWMLYLVLFAQKYGTRARLASLLAIYGALILSGFIAHQQVTRQTEQALVNAKNEIHGQLVTGNMGAASPGSASDLAHADTTALGKYGQFVQFMRATMAKSLSLRNDYLLELVAIGWESILDADRVSADPTFAESRFIIRRARQIVEKYSKRADQFLDDAISEARIFDFGEAPNESVRASYVLSTEQSRQDARRMWDLEAKSVEEFGSIIEMLARTRSNWNVRDHMITFDRPDDLAEFNAHLAAIRQLADEQHAIRVRNISAVDMAFDAIAGSAN